MTPTTSLIPTSGRAIVVHHQDPKRWAPSFAFRLRELIRDRAQMNLRRRTSSITRMAKVAGVTHLTFSRFIYAETQWPRGMTYFGACEAVGIRLEVKIVEDWDYE